MSMELGRKGAGGGGSGGDRVNGGLQMLGKDTDTWLGRARGGWGRVYGKMTFLRHHCQRSS